MTASEYRLFAIAFFAGSHLLVAAPMSGPLRVSTENPRYFVDPAGKVVNLTGLHAWANFQDQGDGAMDTPPKFDYARYLGGLRRSAKSGEIKSTGASVSFRPPFQGEAVLYLKR